MGVGVRLHVWGEYACFTRPEMKVERVSYETITPAAARGILEAIYWKPEIRWRVNRLHVLKQVRLMSIRRNELATKVPAASASRIMKGGTGALGVFIEDSRQQRAATVLRDVAYVIEGTFDIVGGENNPGKHLDQFNRRARKGQCYHRPYLGCRENPADFALLEPTDLLPTSEYFSVEEWDLGLVLHDIDFEDAMTPRFFKCVIRKGVIDVPLLIAGQPV